ncbi:MAG TPA: HEAT repeat domain-containing protein, partial [Terriglobia bacterium]|nr:HEAT repeat domain-containing protein [Terriglobia bacterium]
MARKTEERIVELKRLRVGAPEAAEPLLKKALLDKSNLVVAEAAKIAGDLQRSGLIPDLLAAFTRLFDDPVKNDPKCWGKTAIIKTLTGLDFGESAPFLRAAAHIQMEPVYGGQEDSAVHLRANAVLALVQCTDLTRPEILRCLVDALADASDTVRIEAIRALEQMNGDEAGVLLRLKAHAGDKRSAVIGQVFDSLLALERERAVAFVGRFMKSPDPETRDEAALALGASRLTSAVERLIEAWKESRGRELGSVLLRALSSSRDETALEFLLGLVREGLSRDSAA